MSRGTKLQLSSDANERRRKRGGAYFVPWPGTVRSFAWRIRSGALVARKKVPSSLHAVYPDLWSSSPSQMKFPCRWNRPIFHIEIGPARPGLTYFSVLTSKSMGSIYHIYNTRQRARQTIWPMCPSIGNSDKRKRTERDSIKSFDFTLLSDHRSSTFDLVRMHFSDRFARKNTAFSVEERPMMYVQSIESRLSVQSWTDREARFECLRFAPLSAPERNASIIFTARQKRNLIVDKDRRGKAESESGKKGDKGRESVCGAMGPPVPPSSSPPSFLLSSPLFLPTRHVPVT